MYVFELYFEFILIKKYIKNKIQYSGMAKDKAKDLSGLAFVGFFFIGLTLGAYYSRWDIGPLAGLAMGFIAALLVKMKYAKD